MGTFHVGCKIENHVDRTQAATIQRALVDTGSEYTWIPAKTLETIGVAREKKDLAFTMANGQTVTRSVGFVIVRVEKHFTIDEVVFGEPGDMVLLGARTLEGLSLVVDSRKKRLVAAGPLPAAAGECMRDLIRNRRQEQIAADMAFLSKAIDGAPSGDPSDEEMTEIYAGLKAVGREKGERRLLTGGRVFSRERTVLRI